MRSSRTLGCPPGRERARERRGQALDLAVDDDRVDALLAPEVLVDHGLGHLGARGDLLDARALEALLGEQDAAHLRAAVRGAGSPSCGIWEVVWSLQPRVHHAVPVLAGSGRTPCWDGARCARVMCSSHVLPTSRTRSGVEHGAGPGRLFSGRAMARAPAGRPDGCARVRSVRLGVIGSTRVFGAFSPGSSPGGGARATNPMGAPVTDAVPDAPPVPAAVIVLAAGAGTRMKSATPKVLHPLARTQHARPRDGRRTRPVAAADRRRGPPRARPRGRRRARGRPDGPAWWTRTRCPGPGEPSSARSRRSTSGRRQRRPSTACRSGTRAVARSKGSRASVVVLAGDIPLLDAATLTELLAAHHSGGNAVTVLTTEVDDATGYGRIVRDEQGGRAEHRRAQGRDARAARHPRDQLVGLRVRRRRSCAARCARSRRTTRRARST